MKGERRKPPILQANKIFPAIRAVWHGVCSYIRLSLAGTPRRGAKQKRRRKENKMLTHKEIEKIVSADIHGPTPSVHRVVTNHVIVEHHRTDHRSRFTSVYASVFNTVSLSEVFFRFIIRDGVVARRFRV